MFPVTLLSVCLCLGHDDMNLAHHSAAKDTVWCQYILIDLLLTKI
jgi:hypothetical protein